MKPIHFIKFHPILNRVVLACMVFSFLSMADPTEPVNPNATPEVRRMLKFLGQIYRKKVLTGQHERDNRDDETKRIKQLTGKEPVVRGFDFIKYTDGGYSGDGETEMAIKWGKRGGICTFNWHWYSPVGGHSYRPKTGEWSSSGSTFDITKAVITGSTEHKATLRHLDIIAVELKKLSDAKIPVFFRPLHEAEGAWFWWGAKGPDACKAFWKLIFNYLTDHHKLNNIIWVWTHNNNPKFEWYPGDDCVDIVGADLYGSQNKHVSWIEVYEKLYNYYKDKKLIALTENGPIPDMDKLIQDKAYWLWFATWWGDFINTKWTSVDQLKKVYSHPDVITLDQIKGLYDSLSTVKVIEDKGKSCYHTRAFQDHRGLCIQVHLDQPGNASLSIFDASGRTIREALFRNLPGGQANLRWNGLDTRGNPIKPGVYLYSIKTTNMTVSNSAVINLPRL